MVDLPPDRDPVEVLAEEFIERLRLGENPSVDEYAEKYPELAGEIRELFPTIATMENLKIGNDSSSLGTASLGTMKLKQLGDFHILRELGRGGMGIVYEARQESLERTVAVKVLPQSALLDEKHLQRFQREARTAANLHHTNIVPVFGVGHQDHFHYYVMQYIEGAGLDQVLSRLEQSETTSQKSDIHTIVRELAATVGPRNETEAEDADFDWSSAASASDAALHRTQSYQGDPLTTTPADALRSEEIPRPSTATKRIDKRDSSYWYTAAQIGIQVAEALEYAHAKGVLHRDIKPANLIVDTQEVVWVADFGLAKALEQDHLSRSGDILGTPAYMAPEQLQGHTDHRSDIYSLGITLYELLTLRSAFPETNRSRLLERITNEEPIRPRQVCPDIPRDLETIVLKATAHDPKHRYQSAGNLAADLHRFLENRPIQARRTSSVERFWRWCRRNPLVAGLSATAILLLILVAISTSVGYVHTARALKKADRALAGERAERQRAEAANDLALEALDKIYERFAPPTMGESLVQETTEGANGNRRRRPAALSEETAAVLEDLLTFYDRLAEQEGGNEKYLAEIALASRRVGDIRHNLGQLEKAKIAYKRAIKLYEQLDNASPEKPYRLEIALTYTELGLMYDRLRDRAKAKEQWNTSQKILLELAKQNPKNKSVHLSLERTKALLSQKKGAPPQPFGSDQPLGPLDHPPGSHEPRPPRPGFPPPPGFFKERR